MLDASKAFDRVNFWLLFQKLLSRNVPLFIVRILAMWYTHKKMCIRWGNDISPSFTVSNGVKQGGIISPNLFNVYMDGLSVLLNSSNIEGHIGYTFLNHYNVMQMTFSNMGEIMLDNMNVERHLACGMSCRALLRGFGDICSLHNFI